MIDKKIQNFDKKITQFAENKLGKIREAQAAADPSDLARAIQRAARELDSLDKKLSKLSEKFSTEELSGVTQHLEKQRKAFEAYHAQDTQHDNQDVLSSNTSVKDKTNDKVAQKDIKKFMRKLNQFASFELEGIRDKEDGKPQQYINEVDSGIKKLEKLEKQFSILETKYASEELAEAQTILSDFQEEIAAHQVTAQRKQDEEAYVHSRSKAFDKLAKYFSEAPDNITNPMEIIDVCLKDGFTYTFADTQTLLEIEKPSNSFIRNGQTNYQKSDKNLNDDAFIETIYALLDNVKIDTREKEESLASLYQAIALIKDNMFPDHNKLDDLLFYINKLRSQREEAREEAIQNIVVSDFHRNHINQVFFTSEEIKPVASLNQEDFKTEFLPGETIRCITFLDNSFENIYGKNNHPSFRLSDQMSTIKIEEFTTECLKKGYIDFKLATNGQSYHLPTTAQASSVEKAMEYLLQLPLRTKIIHVKVDGYHDANGSSPKAKLIGDFKIDGSDTEGRSIMQENLYLVKNQVIGNVQIPEARMNNPAYEAEILALFNGFDWIDNIKQVIITSPDFFVFKNWEGVAIGRGLYVTLIFVDEERCYMQDFTIAQDPMGNEWSKFRLEARGPKSKISCDKIKI